MSQKKIIEIEERIPTLKERRRQLANRRLVIYISLFFLLMTVVAYFQSSFSHVKYVEVKGNFHVSEDWIIQKSNLLPEVSMWLLNGEEVKFSLLDHPEIAEVNVTRNTVYQGNHEGLKDALRAIANKHSCIFIVDPHSDYDLAT